MTKISRRIFSCSGDRFKSHRVNPLLTALPRIGHGADRTVLLKLTAIDCGVVPTVPPSNYSGANWMQLAGESELESLRILNPVLHPQLSDWRLLPTRCCRSCRP